jgi:hypothetical protein
MNSSHLDLALGQERISKMQKRISEPYIRSQILSSWKEIAAYTGKGVRTVQRWEARYGLPVRRPESGGVKGVVIIEVNDLNAWLAKNFVARRHPAETNMTGSAGRSLEGHISHTIADDCDWTIANQALWTEVNEAWRRLIECCGRSAKLRLDLNWLITAPNVFKTASIDSGVTRVVETIAGHNEFKLPDTA